MLSDVDLILPTEIILHVISLTRPNKTLLLVSKFLRSIILKNFFDRYALKINNNMLLSDSKDYANCKTITYHCADIPKKLYLAAQSPLKNIFKNFNHFYVKTNVRNIRRILRSPVFNNNMQVDYICVLIIESDVVNDTSYFTTEPIVQIKNKVFSVSNHTTSSSDHTIFRDIHSIDTSICHFYKISVCPISFCTDIMIYDKCNGPVHTFQILKSKLIIYNDCFPEYLHRPNKYYVKVDEENMIRFFKKIRDSNYLPNKIYLSERFAQVANKKLNQTIISNTIIFLKSDIVNKIENLVCNVKNYRYDDSISNSTELLSLF